MYGFTSSHCSGTRQQLQRLLQPIGIYYSVLPHSHRTYHKEIVEYRKFRHTSPVVAVGQKTTSEGRGIKFTILLYGHGSRAERTADRDRNSAMSSLKNFAFCIANFSLLPTPLASQQSCSSLSTWYPGDQAVSFSKIPFSGQEVVSSSSA